MKLLAYSRTSPPPPPPPPPPSAPRRTDYANVTSDGKYGKAKRTTSQKNLPTFDVMDWKNVVPVALLNLVLLSLGKTRQDKSGKTAFEFADIKVRETVSALSLLAFPIS